MKDKSIHWRVLNLLYKESEEIKNIVEKCGEKILRRGGFTKVLIYGLKNE